MRRAQEMWPNFFIVGAPKAGTTSLYHYLRQAPGVFLPICKEPHYFSLSEPTPGSCLLFRPITRKSKYLALFRGSEHHKARGDASPSYLVTESAAIRIRAEVADAKIIIMLRDPIQRAFS